MRDFTLDRRNFLTTAATTTLLATAADAAAAPAKSSGHDVIVVGAGVFGVWTAWRLQQGGAKVLLVDAWAPGHSRSTSGGETRLIRTEYRGNQLYTRWAWESLADWKALGKRHEAPIFVETGALYIFPEEDAIVDQSIALQKSLGIPIEKLPPAELMRRWPQIDFTGIAVGVLQPTMGALMARRSVQTLKDDFVKRGGQYRQAAILPPKADAARLAAITTTSGETLTADKFVFACGPWLPKLFPEVVGKRIVATRQDVFFFLPEAGDARFDSPHFPAFVDVSSPMLHYGFPNIEARGFKVALDRHGPPIDPDTNDRVIAAKDLADVRAYLRTRFPAIAERPLSENRVCQYENTDNGHLLIDRHPVAANVWLAGGGSGHGFKHGPAVGRYLAGLVTGSVKAEEALGLAAHKEH